MREDQAIRKLLASSEPAELRQGLERIRSEIARVGAGEARPYFEMVAALFYIDPLDRPDLVPVLDDAVSLVVGFGDWVIPVLVEQLDAGDLKAQMAIGHALGRIGADAIGPLIEAFAGTADPSRRAFILYALGKIRSPQVARALETVLGATTSENLELRDTAIRTLGKLCASIPPGEVPAETCRQATETLQRALADANAGIRAKAVRSLGKLARHGHLSPADREMLGDVCHRLLGDDERFEWDRAFVVRREAEEALRYL